MGILQSFNQWRESRYENHLSNMEAQNKCPDCNGRGYHTYPVNEFVYLSNQLECPGCNGSGQFSDWSEIK